MGTLFSIHNVGYQGIFPAETLDLIGLADDLAGPTGPLEYYGKVNFMKAAILYADLINTVSERYAEEIQSGERVRLRSGGGAARRAGTTCWGS